MKPELRIRFAIIDRLRSSGHLDDDTVVVSEMTLRDWSRRADLVVANGRLSAFEIKSHADRLDRLPGQLSAFLPAFERFTVVAAERFESKLVAALPTGVGLWLAIEHAESIKLVERIRSRILKPEKTALIDHLSTAELRVILRGLSVDRPLSAMVRQELTLLAKSLPYDLLLVEARRRIKDRHRNARFCRVAPADPAPLNTTRLTSILTEADEQNPLFLRAPAGPILRRHNHHQKSSSSKTKSSSVS